MFQGFYGALIIQGRSLKVPFIRVYYLCLNCFTNDTHDMCINLMMYHLLAKNRQRYIVALIKFVLTICFLRPWHIASRALHVSAGVCWIRCTFAFTPPLPPSLKMIDQRLFIQEELQNGFHLQC